MAKRTYQENVLVLPKCLMPLTQKWILSIRSPTVCKSTNWGIARLPIQEPTSSEILLVLSTTIKKKEQLLVTHLFKN